MRPHPSIQEPLPQESFILVVLSFLIITINAVCQYLGQEKKIFFKKWSKLHFTTNMVTPKQARTTVPGVTETNLEGISLLAISSIRLLYAQKNQWRVLKKNINFTDFTPKIKTL